MGRRAEVCPAFGAAVYSARRDQNARHSLSGFAGGNVGASDFSTIHANSVPDAVNALVKYAGSGGISEEMAYELVAGSLLGCIHQVLVGVPKKLKVSTLFTNPDVTKPDQVRNIIKSGKLNFATVMEAQNIKMLNGKPLFADY